MRARTLNHLITIQDASSTKNSFGGKVETWTTFAQAWASIEQIKDSDIFDNNQLHKVSLRKFRIRFIPDITLDMRIKYENRIFEIIEITNLYESNKELLIMSKEIS